MSIWACMNDLNSSTYHVNHITFVTHDFNIISFFLQGRAKNTIYIIDHPGLDHIFIRLGPAPPTPPSLSSLPTCTCVGTLPRWEPMWFNTWALKSLTPLSSFGMWRNTINSLGNYESDVNLNIRNFDRVLSHWFPTRKSSHTSVDRMTGQWKRRGKDGGLAEWRCDLDWGP